MIWSDLKPPLKDESWYDHITCDTPLGEASIEWKSRKEFPTYDIMLGDMWIGSENTLGGAKETAYQYIHKKSEDLKKFLET